MTNTVYELTAAVALNAAARAAGVDVTEITDHEIRLSEGYYEIRFTGKWARYDCFVDAATGFVPGLMSAPLAA